MSPIGPLSRQIWDMKYRLKAADGTAIEMEVTDTWRRVARALASVEARPSEWEGRFYEAMEGFKFVPAGRILAGAGTERAVTLFNCFVMGTIPDDMGGIFEHLREAALTMQQGGGIGYDFSTLRPQGAPVAGVGADASGPVSFMDVWDAMCRTIMSAGHRRGAMMGTLRCDHPDIELFVTAKADPTRLRMFNLSVLATDAFLEAVDAGAPWPLRFGDRVSRTVPARELWDAIMRATYEQAEPGVVFIDRVNRLNPLSYIETISATNPCGEQPLPPYGACLLGSVNLARLVLEPFTGDARLDLDALRDLATIAVRMMDNVIEISRFPLAAQAHEARSKRRLGLGVTGLADALIQCGARYGSAHAVTLTERWLAVLKDAACRASIELAKERGPFDRFDGERYLSTEASHLLDEDLRDGIGRHGIRNAVLTSIAPAGTISLFADAVSSGIEPVYALRQIRTVLMQDGTRQQLPVTDAALRLHRALKGPDTPLPPAFVEVADLMPEDHLAMQAAAQRHVDGAISKTVNCPADISFEDFRGVYHRAYALGCKGCTTWRPNAVTGAILTDAATAETCPRCGGLDLISQGGCGICADCGYSYCG